MHAAQANATILTKMQQYHTLALVNLAIATQSNRTLIALLTNTISDFSSQVATLTAKLATAQSENTHMEKSVHRSAPAQHGHLASSNRTPSYHNLIQDCHVYSRRGHKFDPNGYCSSHGYMVEESHRSTTFRFPVNGHNKYAIQLDNKGGDT